MSRVYPFPPVIWLAVLGFPVLINLSGVISSEGFPLESHGNGKSSGYEKSVIASCMLLQHTHHHHQPAKSPQCVP